MDGLNIVRAVVSPGTSHAFGLDVVGNDFLAVSEALVTDSAVSLLRRDFLGEHFPQFRG